MNLQAEQFFEKAKKWKEEFYFATRNHHRK
jgi:hypothetical protein